MGKAVRAIILRDEQMLLMHRNKYGSEYFTLVGGLVNDNETAEQALAREIKEETGLTLTSARLVFIEEHPEPYSEQYIYLCEVAPGSEAAIQDYSEEGQMNVQGMDMHAPKWAQQHSLDSMSFRTPQLQKAIVEALKHGWPKEPVKL